MNYTEAVEYIENVPKFAKKNKPENTLELIRRIGHPERGMKIVHVAGTNGKGSVCAFLSSILTGAGKRTGLFTSPHLVDLTERFQINGEEVSRDAFTRAFGRVKRAVDAMIAEGFFHPAYFELLFATGLLIFEEAQVEYLVLETGLGGRLDATNLVERPIACVLTTIGLDHMEYLGNTVAEIAGEKAGIIREGVPVIYDGRNPEAEAVILQKAAAMRAPAYRYDDTMCEIIGKTDKSIDFILNRRYDKNNAGQARPVAELYENLRVRVPYPARYQVVNSALALAALRVIDPEKTVSDEQAAAGILVTRWPGRMETVLTDVVLDGAHNADGIREFVRTVQSVQERRSVSLLFSAVAEKEYEKMIRSVCEGIRLTSIVVTQIEGARMVPARELAEIFRRYTSAPVTAREDVEGAFREALVRRGDGVLFCAGSLYLIGELKAIIRRGTYDQL